MLASPTTYCPDCGHPIRWTITAAGRRLPVNPDPDDSGNTAVYTDAVGTTKSRRITPELPLQAYEWRAMPHVATCPTPRPRRPRRTPARAASTRWGRR